MKNSSYGDLSFQINKTKIKIIEKDIKEAETDAVVSSDDTLLTMSGGVSKAISDKAGSSISSEIKKQKVFLKNHPLERGDVLVSSAGDEWTARYILHAITVNFNSVRDKFNDELFLEYQLISHLIMKILDISYSLKIESVAIPLLGGGFAKLNKELVFELILQNILYHLASRDIPLKEIDLFVLSSDVLSRSQFDRLKQLSVESNKIQDKMNAIKSLRNELDIQDKLNTTLNQRLIDLQNELQDLFFLESARTELEKETSVKFAVDLREMRELLCARFNDNELRELCFQLDIDYEDIPGVELSYKIREFLSYLRRRDLLGRLIDVGKELRNDIDWPQRIAG